MSDRRTGVSEDDARRDGAAVNRARVEDSARAPRTPLLASPLSHALAVPILYAIFFAIFFAPVVLGGRLLAPGDATHFFVPNFYGPRVWWDALVWAGTPRFADPQAMFWYPPHLVFRLLPGGWNLFVLFAYTTAASATYGYVFRLTRARLAAAVSGTTYALCGFMIAHAVHTSMIHAAAWLPLVVWSLEELRRGDGARARLWFVAGAVAVALCALAGHPQIFLYTLALAATLSIFRARGASQGALRYLSLCAALLVVGTGLAAPQLVPTAELSQLTERAALTFESFTAYSLPPRQLVTFIFPLAYGGAPQTFYHSPYFGAWASEGGGWNASEVTGYVGLLPLLLAFVAVVSRRRRGLVLVWSGVALVALLLALGCYAPLSLVTYHLPLFDKFRAPARHLLELSFAASVLAGLGVSAITRGDVTTRQLKRVAACALAVAVIALAALAIFRAGFDAQAVVVMGREVSLAPWKNPATAVPLLVLAAACAALLWWSRRASSRARSGALLLVLVCDLGSLAWFSEWRAASPSLADLAPPPVALRMRDSLSESNQRLLAVRGGLGRDDEVPPEQSRLWKVPSAGGYGPLQLARVGRLLSMLPHGAIMGDWADPSDRSLDALAVRYVTAPREDPTGGAESNGARPAEITTGGLRADDSRKLSDPQSTTVVGLLGGGMSLGDDLNVALGKGCGASRESAAFALPAPARATHLVTVSQLACADQIADATPVLSVTLRDAQGHTAESKVLAGRDTSEWAYDCADVRARVRHTRAPVFTTYTTDRRPAPCAGHDYLSEIALDAPFEIKGIELRWAGGDAGSIAIKKLSLLDAGRVASRPVTAADAALGDTARWRLDSETEGALVFENLRAQPRAWMVNEVVTLSADDALAAIRTSRLPDGRAFDPASDALVEGPLESSLSNVGTQTEGLRATTHGLAGADSCGCAQGLARIVSESDARLEIRADSLTPSFLVLADAYYPGWRALLDGQDARVYQTDYALRGVFVPEGKHTVVFELRPRSFRIGLLVSCAALVVLVLFAAPFNPLWRAAGDTTKHQ